MFTNGLTEIIFSKRNKVRFHTPGHSGKINKNLINCDVTELSYTDNLLNPTTFIKKLEQDLAFVYKTEACFISTQGATNSIFCAVHAVKKYGAFLIVGNAHKSVYNALRINLCKTFHTDNFNVEDIPKEVKNVIITTPNYLGLTFRLEEIYPSLKSKGINLIVDASHGSHFIFHQDLPVSATENADLVIHSLHKTLPVVTGGSLLCCKGVYSDDVYYARKIYHSSSPNFVTICSIERAFYTLSKKGKALYEKVKKGVDKFKKSDLGVFKVEKSDDFSRLVISSCFDGNAVNEYLIEKGFVSETVMGAKLVFIVTPYNIGSLSKLAYQLRRLTELKAYTEKKLWKETHDKPTLIEFFDEYEIVDVADAVGRKAFNEIGFYPPGTPYIYSGEIITQEDVDVLSKEKIALDVFGLENNKVFVVK